MSNPIDQIDAMLALCARATPLPEALEAAFSQYRRLFHQEPHGTAKQMAAMAEFMPPMFAASRTGWEATLRALRVACEALDTGASILCRERGGEFPDGGSQCAEDVLREALAKITEELEATQ